MYVMLVLPLSDFYLVGCGKTLYTVYYAAKYQDNYKKIYANFHIDNTLFKNNNKFEYIDDETLLHVITNENYNLFEPHSLLIIDEIGYFFDSRRAIKKENVEFTRLLKFVRKLDLQILGTDQNEQNIDKRIRHHTNFTIKTMPIDKNMGLYKINYYLKFNFEPFHSEILNLKPFYGKYDTLKIPKK